MFLLTFILPTLCPTYTVTSHIAKQSSKNFEDVNITLRERERERESNHRMVVTMILEVTHQMQANTLIETTIEYVKIHTQYCLYWFCLLHQPAPLLSLLVYAIIIQLSTLNFFPLLNDYDEQLHMDEEHLVQDLSSSHVKM